MDWNILRSIMSDALGDFAICDKTLLQICANERSITHKLAEYIRDRFEEQTGEERRSEPRIAVDCEYNRFGAEGEPKRLPWCREAINQEGEVYYTPSPDICLHHRTDQAANALIIEVKTRFNATDDAVLLDKMKLVAYLEAPLHYEFGVFVILGVQDGGLKLSEARLAARGVVASVEEERRYNLWLEGQMLLTEETKKGLKLRRSNVDRDAARRLIARFDDVYGLRDVRPELYFERWQ